MSASWENCHHIHNLKYASNNYNETIWAFLGEPETNYIRVFYEPTDPNSKLQGYWSGFIKVPQAGTYERLLIVKERKPDGYMWSMYKCYDENKKGFTPEGIATTVASSEKVY